MFRRGCLLTFAGFPSIASSPGKSQYHAARAIGSSVITGTHLALLGLSIYRVSEAGILHLPIASFAQPNITVIGSCRAGDTYTVALGFTHRIIGVAPAAPKGSVNRRRIVRTPRSAHVSPCRLVGQATLKCGSTRKRQTDICNYRPCSQDVSAWGHRLHPKCIHLRSGFGLNIEV